jgi:2-hydroxy-5-methyl-1-naphthoate 7-hydroxylase
MTSHGPIARLASHGGDRLHSQIDELRAAGPAVRVALPEGVTAWAVTRGETVRQLLTHPDVSKDARESWPGYTPGAIAWLFPFVDVKSMFTSDGSEHRRLRRLVGPAFTHRRVEAMRPAVEALVDQLLGELEEFGQDVVDLRGSYAYRIPTGVICDLFGVPVDQRQEMLSCIDAVLMTAATQEEAADVRDGINSAMAKLIDTKRRQPGEDMTSLLLAHGEDGDRLTEEELVSTLILMIGAGSETAVALIDTAMRELLTDRGQLRSVLDDPRRWADVIEEALRLGPPVVFLPMHYARADIDLGEGCVIRQGDAILIGFGGHGRDPQLHAVPGEFDIDREDRQHLAFGHGIHYCLGAPLARLEAEIALSRLFERFPRAELAVPAGELRPTPSFITDDVTALPARLRTG